MDFTASDVFSLQREVTRLRRELDESRRTVAALRTELSSATTSGLRDEPKPAGTAQSVTDSITIVDSGHHVAEPLRSDETRAKQVRFLEGLDRVNRVIQLADDVDQMLWNVAEAVRSIFGTDRVWLLHPCDPDASSFRVPVERNRPEYPGACELNLEVPMSPGQARDMRDALAADGAVGYTEGTENPVCEETASRFGVRAQMFVAVYPKTGQPWMFGTHQCSHPRLWTPDEKRLFEAIARRLGDGLSSALAHRELRLSEERFRTLIEQAADAFALVDFEGHILDANRSACESLGYDREELLAMNIADVDVEARSHRHKEELWDQLQPGKPVTFEGVNRRKDGSTFPVEVRLAIVELGGERYMQAFSRDISERRRMMEALQESEGRLREAQQLARLGSWYWDIASGKVDWSDEVYRIFQLDPETFSPQIDSIMALSPWPEDHQRDKELLERAARTHEPGSFEQKFLRPDGSSGYYLSTYQGVFDGGGKLTGMKGTVQDITERRQAEEALRASEERYRLAQRLSGVGTWEWNVTTNDVFWSDEVVSTWGFASGEFGGTYDEVVARIHPEDRDRWRESVRTCVEDGREHDVEFRVVLPDDEVRWVAAFGDAERGPDGEVVRMLGVVKDVTDRKRAQEAIEVSERNYREVFDGTTEMIFVHDAETGSFKDVNKAALDAFGFTKEEVMSLTLNEMSLGVPPFSLEDGIRAIRMAALEGPQTFEWYARNKSGDLLWCENRLTRVVIGGEDCVLCVARDITARKQAEDDLAKAQALLVAAVEESPAGIVIADAPDGRIRTANSAAIGIRGPAGQALVDIPVELHSDRWQVFCPNGTPFPPEELPLSRAVLRGETSENVEAIIRRADGEERRVLNNAAPVHNSEGEIVAAVVVFLDVTELWTAEAEIRKLNAELEQRVQLRTAELAGANEQLRREVNERRNAENRVRQEQEALRQLIDLQERDRKLLAYEIHDGLTQELVGAHLTLHAVCSQEDRNSPRSRECIDASLKLLTQSIAEARRLIGGLRPPALDDAGIVSAIEWLVDEARKTDLVDVDFVSDGRFDRLAPPLESTIYRIVQECLANVRRHSRSHKARVEASQLGDRVRLTVQDWGVGFVSGAVPQGHFGLEGMRERARLFGGSMAVHSVPGEGTTVTVELPLVDVSPGRQEAV